MACALPHRAPDALGGGGHCDVGDAEWESASRMAFMMVGVETTVPPSPTPLAPNGLVLLGTGLKWTVIAGIVSARGMP